MTSIDPDLAPTFDVDAIRKDFPILQREVHGVPLVYLDTANSSQKPQVVLDTLSEFYAQHYSNVARAVHTLGSEATNAFEGARDKVAAFINAPSREEVVFTKNSSEALNLVAYSLSNATTTPGAEKFRLGPGDEIVVTEMEHHSNIVPWQLLAQRTGATFRWIEIDDAGRLIGDQIDSVINERTKVVAFVHQSNALGTVNDVHRIVARAKAVGALTVVDASQSAPHRRLDVQDLGADFVAFTGHKLYGPSGIGVLWGRFELLEAMPPFLGGGEMIETVSMTGTTFAAPPHRFEAGTPPIAEAVGLGAAIDYINAIGIDAIAAHEQMLTAYALDVLQQGRGSAHHRPDRCNRPRRDHLLHHRRYAPARRQPAAGRAGHRGAGRAPLCTPGLRAVRHPGHHAGIVRDLHHDRRDRCPGGRNRRRQESVRYLVSESMYQEIILDHYKHPQHHGLIDVFDAEVHHVNPTCGDEVTLRLNLVDGTIADLGWDGMGCSISQASTSVMSDLVIGKTADDALALQKEFLELMQSRGEAVLDEAAEERLDDAVAFEGVAKYPARVKCALLGWMAMKSALASAVETKESA